MKVPAKASVKVPAKALVKVPVKAPGVDPVKVPKQPMTRSRTPGDSVGVCPQSFRIPISRPLSRL